MIELIYSTIQRSKDGDLVEPLSTEELNEALDLFITEMDLITAQSGGDTTVVFVEVEGDLSHDGGMSW